MEDLDVILFLLSCALAPALAGTLLALGGYFLMKRFPTALPWPLFLFLVLLGGAGCNVSAVCYTGAWAVFHSGGSFLGDDFTAVVFGMMLAVGALAGVLASLTTRKLRNGKAPSPLAAWGWGWLLSQSALHILIFLLGLLPFRSFPDGRGLPLGGYLLLMAVAIPALGFLFGRLWGRGHGPMVPLLGCLFLSVLGLFLTWMMFKTAHDPAWGLSLIQTRAGGLYARLYLPSAILLGDYQYRWDITPVKVCLLTLAPHLLFAIGYMLPGLLQRGTRHA